MRERAGPGGDHRTRPHRRRSPRGPARRRRPALGAVQRHGHPPLGAWRWTIPIRSTGTRSSRASRSSAASSRRSPSPCAWTTATASSPPASGASRARHLIFGGEEWWFYGCPDPAGRPAVPGAALPRLQGDRHQVRRPDHVLAAATRSTPTSTARLVAKERSTSIRYLAAEAEKRGIFAEPARPIRQLDAGRAARDRQAAARLAACPTARASRRTSRRSKVGDKLPRRVIGPHSIASFTTEYRAFMFRHLGHLALGRPGKA